MNKKKVFEAMSVMFTGLMIFVGASTKPDAEPAAVQGKSIVMDVDFDDVPEINIDTTFTVAEICQGYLDADPQFNELYYKLDHYSDDGWINIDGDLYYPGATYSGDWTDVSAVADSWRKDRQSWAKCEDWYWSIWTEDYAHEYTVMVSNPYWLQLDGSEVWPLVDRTYDLNPVSLITDYQSDSWNGDVRFSDNYLTKARIEWRGRIQYYYDGLHYARVDENVLKFVSSATPAYEDEAYDIFVEEDYCENDRRFGKALSARYVDLPMDSDLDPIDSIYKGSEQGTFFLTEGGVNQFRKGQLINSWEFAEISNYDDAFMAIINPSKDDAYVYNGSDFVRLCADGTTEVLMENVIDAWYNYEGTIEAVSVNDGVFTYGYHSNGDFIIHEVEKEDLEDVCRNLHFEEALEESI